MDNEQYQLTFQERNKKLYVKHLLNYKGDKTSLVLFDLSKKYLKEPILDIGAGTGALIKTLKSKGYKESCGVDLYPKVDFVKKGTITNIPENDNSFNTVFCTEVIEHLTNEQIDKGLKEVNRVIRKKGFFILTTPFNENLELNSYVCPHCNKKFHKVGHLQSFNKKRIKDLLEKKGFDVISIKVYALGAMSKLPLGRYFNWLFLRMKYEFIGKTMVIICRKI
jgi:ubiquinone/menaquinone biosynthesis C-methylase UbiE